MKNLIIEPNINNLDYDNCDNKENEITEYDQIAFFLVIYINNNYTILEKLFQKCLKSTNDDDKKVEIFKLLAVLFTLTLK